MLQSISWSFTKDECADCVNFVHAKNTRHGRKLSCVYLIFIKKSQVATSNSIVIKNSFVKHQVIYKQCKCFDMVSVIISTGLKSSMSCLQERDSTIVRQALCRDNTCMRFISFRLVYYVYKCAECTSQFDMMLYSNTNTKTHTPGQQ